MTLAPAGVCSDQETGQSSAASDPPEPDPQGKTRKTASPDLPLVAPSLSWVPRSRPQPRRIMIDAQTQAEFFNKIRRERPFIRRSASGETQLTPDLASQR